MNIDRIYADLARLKGYADRLGWDVGHCINSILTDVTALAEENEDLRAELDGLRPIATALTLIRQARTDALLTRAGLGPRGDT